MEKVNLDVSVLNVNRRYCVTSVLYVLMSGQLLPNECKTQLHSSSTFFHNWLKSKILLPTFKFIHLANVLPTTYVFPM